MTRCQTKLPLKRLPLKFCTLQSDVLGSLNFLEKRVVTKNKLCTYKRFLIDLSDSGPLNANTNLSPAPEF